MNEYLETSGSWSGEIRGASNSDVRTDLDRLLDTVALRDSEVRDLTARVADALLVLERVRVLADQYAATAQVHAKVRDTVPRPGTLGGVAGAVPSAVTRARAAALAGMAYHHADQLHTALEGPTWLRAALGMKP